MYQTPTETAFRAAPRGRHVMTSAQATRLTATHTTTGRAPARAADTDIDAWTRHAANANGFGDAVA